LILLALLWPLSSHAQAAPQMPLDAVVLVDDSGSMRKTDPLKLRFSAFSLFTRLLRQNDAVGLVKFDEGARLVRPLQRLAADRDRSRLDGALTRFSTRGAYTDLYAGLKAALAEMRQRGRAQAEQAVVLISDGLMDVNPASGLSNEARLQALRTTLLPAYRAAQVKIITLGLSPAADRPLLEEIATATDGRFFYVPQAEALSEAFYRVFDDLKRPAMVAVEGQRVSIDPAVQEATFFIMAGTAKADVALVRPDGVKIDSQHREPTVAWYAGADYALVTVQKPSAGTWQVITAQPRPIKVAVVTDVRLEVALHQAGDPTKPQIQIAARLTGEGPASLGPLPLAELTFTAEIVPPGAAAATILTLSSQADPRPTGEASAPVPLSLGHWHSTVFTPASATGEYQGRVIARAPTFSREKSFAFRVPSQLATPPMPQTSGASAAEAQLPHVLASSPPETPLSSPPSRDIAAREGERRPETEAATHDLALWSNALQRWAIGHAILFGLGGFVLLGLRLRRGVWWPWR
jgi:Mg-chelatase subunit ChlD